MLRDIIRAQIRATAEPKVRLINPSVREPANAVEQTVIATLEPVDTISLNSLVQRVAQALYKEELAMGAGILDIALWGPDLFVRDVAAVLSAGDGILWSIESSR